MTLIKAKSDKRARINSDITAKMVRLVDVDSEQLGVVPLREAQDKAKAAGLDLVEIAPQAAPPVCRIMDYGKYVFDQKKKKDTQKKQSKKTQVKEIKFRPQTDIGDFNIKLRKITDFLESGHKVKVTVRFRGREMMYHEQGIELLERVKEGLADRCVVDNMPKQEGRQISMMISPKK